MNSKYSVNQSETITSLIIFLKTLSRDVEHRSQHKPTNTSSQPHLMENYHAPSRN